jgi:small conductance mechanosensitive channel|tara:strand:- start:479 stop:1399 length:921 start_codon:yes stop_codon:yes gene_type:complete
MTSEMFNSASPLIALIIDYALDMVGAVLLLIAGWMVAGWVQKHTARMLGAVERVDATLLSFVTQLVRYSILILVMVAVLAQFGVQTTSIIAVLGAAGLAVGLALQGTLANIAAGVLLLFLRPFKIGEYIDAGGVAGTVREIGLFATEFESYDGIFVMVPNSQLASAAITNYSRLPTRRLDLVIGISYGDNMNQAMTVLNDLLVHDDRILKEPAHQVMVKELADSSVNLNLRCWTKRQDYWSLLFDLTKQAKERLDKHGISIPFPQRDVHLFPTEAPVATAGQSVSDVDEVEYAAPERRQTEREESE